MSKNHPPVQLLLIALVIFLSIIFSFWIRPWSIQENMIGWGSDSDTYWHLATNLLAYGHYGEFGWQRHVNEVKTLIPCTYPLPGYPLALAATRTITPGPTAVYLLNVLCVVINALVLCRLAIQLLELSPLGLVLLYCFTPLVLFFTQGINCDLFASCLLLLFTYSLFQLFICEEKWPAKGFMIRLLAVILVGALSILTRTNNLFFIFGLLFLSLIFKNPQKSLKWIILIFLILGLVISGWCARNYVVCKKPAFSTITGTNMFLCFVYYHCSPQDKYWGWRDQKREEYYHQLIHEGNSASQADALLDQKLIELSAQFIKSHPLQACWTAVGGIYHLVTWSYFDLANVLTAKVFHLTKADVAHSEFRPPAHHWIMDTFYWTLEDAEKLFKWLLFFNIFLTPFLVFYWYPRETHFFTLPLGLTIVLFILITGIYGTQVCDRCYLPAHAINLMFLYKNILLGIKKFVLHKKA